MTAAPALHIWEPCPHCNAVRGIELAVATNRYDVKLPRHCRQPHQCHGELVDALRAEEQRRRERARAA